jgi:hypothetical protein
MKLKTIQLLSLVVQLVVLFSLAGCKQFSPNKNDVKLKEVEKLAANLPVHERFHETWNGSVSKSMLASVGKHYKSDARYEDVKNFYVTKLIPEGWQLTKEIPLKNWSVNEGGLQLTFTRGEYSVVLQ